MQRPLWFVRGDLDGFFGLFVDNLLQLMLIAVLCQQCGLQTQFISEVILPGAAVSVLFGNLFYAWQARRLALRTGRVDVTALPYGINTPSLIAFVLFIMKPVYEHTHNAALAWQMGLAACVLSGLIELAGAFCGDWVRRHTPRAALLAALAGVAIAFIAMQFNLQIFATPGVALIPALIVLVAYASRTRFPLGLPGGLVAIVVGTLLGWTLSYLGLFDRPAPQTTAKPTFAWPCRSFEVLLDAALWERIWEYFPIIFPMGLFNVIGSLQNLESAEAAGDRFETRPSLLVNGLGTLVAACLGSPFPTTIYIGHPAWKAMGARAGYSALNGVVLTALCLSGSVLFVLQWVPLEAALGILLWIGILITAQAFSAIPPHHALAVALGLVPALGAWALELVQASARAAGKPLTHVIEPLLRDGIALKGAIALYQGFLLTSMILAAIVVYLIERDLRKAGWWTLAAAALSFVGLIHAYELTGAGVRNCFGLGPTTEARHFALAYALTGIGLLALGLRQSKPAAYGPSLPASTDIRSRLEDRP